MTARLVLVFSAILAASACSRSDLPATGEANVPARYLDNAGRDDVFTGGIKMIPVNTPRGVFRVWTKRTGNNPRVKVLLLHGGPGGTHEYLEAIDSFFPGAGIEYYYYDQLGSYYSDQPDAPELWEVPRFVDEIEQVRRALRLDDTNFYLFGHSWGGMLAVEYALKYQQHLKGLVISNMMMSIPQYNEYAQKVLMPAMDPKALAEIKALEEAGKTGDPRYRELLMTNHDTQHLLRVPADQWPEPLNRTFKHLNSKIHVTMLGPGALGASGKIANWDRTADLRNITVPTLVIGARFDTMDPAHMEWVSKQLPKGQYLLCPSGSHFALYDDQQIFFAGLIRFITRVDAGRR
jgi:proline iminopeptidase